MASDPDTDPKRSETKRLGSAPTGPLASRSLRQTLHGRHYAIMEDKTKSKENLVQACATSRFVFALPWILTPRLIAFWQGVYTVRV